MTFHRLSVQIRPGDFGVSFQGQVTRAQEAEENYVIKRELAVVRQQCAAASESLEKAQDTIRELQQQKVKTGARLLFSKPKTPCWFGLARLARGEAF